MTNDISPADSGQATREIYPEPCYGERGMREDEDIRREVGKLDQEGSLRRA